MIIVIGNSENRRVQFFEEALLKNSLDTKLISYLDILEERVNLTSILAHATGVKIESPGENFYVYKALLLKGANNDVEEELAKNLVREKGRVYHSNQWFRGYTRFLEELDNILKYFPKVRVLNEPQSILRMFDKSQTHQLLKQVEIPKTPFLGEITSYTDLQNLLEQESTHQVFIKLAHGSSASGVLAYRKNKTSEVLIGSVDLVRKSGNIKLFNSLKIQRYTNFQDIVTIIGTLSQNKLIVEQWLPKATWNDKTFDLRMVVIDGKVNHVVMRCSKQPMTNLHLGNERGDVEELKNIVPKETWLNMEKAVCDAVKAMGKAKVAGVDVLLFPKFRKFAIIEVNAFGDLLPNVICEEGKTTYEREADYFL